MSVPHALLALLSGEPKYGLRLQSEFEADRKTMPAPPRTAEISIYKNGQKVQ